MKPLWTGVLVIAGVALGATGGYWLGSHDSGSNVRPAWRESPDSAVRTPEMQSESAVKSRRAEIVRAPLSEAETEKLHDDPQRSIEIALALPNTDERRDQLTRIGEAWARFAPEDAWQEALRVADPAARRALQNAVIATWASQQPERAFASVAELPPDWQRDALLEQVTTEIARRDPYLALELITTVKVPDPDSFRAIIVEEWARYDPSSAAQWIEAQKLRLQGRLAYRIADAYVAQQPGEALDWALRISRSPGRNLWSYMLRQMAVHDPHAALSIALAAENPVQRTQALGGVLGSIAASDPALAMSYLQKLPAGELRVQAVVEIASQLAETAPLAALDWLNSLDDGDARIQAFIRVSNTVANADPDAAAELIERAPKEARPTWISAVANAYAENDLDKAVQWMRKFQEEPGYTRTVQRFAMMFAGRSPEDAFNLIDRTVAGKQRDETLAGVMPMVASQAPETAARWIDEIADDNYRAQAIANVASAWAQHDFLSARKWVTSLPSGPPRDQALVHLAGSGAASLDETLSLLRQIQSPEQRSQAAMNAAFRIGRSDPDGMRTLLRRYPLDPQQQQQLDSMLEQPGWDGW